MSIAIPLFVACLCFAVLMFVRKLVFLRGAESVLRQRQTATTSVPTDAPKGSNPLLRAMADTDAALARAVASRTLLYFDLAGSLRSMERVFARGSGVLRPFSGWMLLAGIVVTLFNLQGSVGNLATAFQQMSPTIGASNDGSAAGVPPALDREVNVTRGMQQMAANASHAFRTSLLFIGLALASMIATAFLDGKARQSLNRYEAWATELYGFHLPHFLPLTEGNVADKLGQTVTGMSEVVEQLRGAAVAFSNLEPLLSSMRDVNDSIQQTMQQLPHELHSSLSTVTSEMVKELSGTLGVSTEHTKKILAIYSEQEVRVRSLHNVLKGQDKLFGELREAHSKLDVLPDQARRLSETAAFIAQSNSQISATLDLLPAEVKKLDDGMRKSEERLSEAAEQMRLAAVSLRALSDETRERETRRWNGAERG